MQYQIVRGMKDVFGNESEKFDFILQTAEKLSIQYNFKKLITPIVEQAALFERNLGDESDVVLKEIYRFEDRSGNMLALRPEMTAGVCRFIIENGLFQGPFPHKFFSYGPVFRYDRPQKGRYRQFNQLNFEIFGLKDASQEIKIYLSFIVEFLTKIGIKDIEVHVNYLGSMAERENYIKELKKYLNKYRDKLSEDSQRRLETNILRILDSKDENDKEILKKAPKIYENLTNEHKKYIDSFKDFKIYKNVRCKIDNNLVRGLDYYTGFVFEIITDKIGETQNAICGGGEYNDLIFNMSKKKLNAFGFAFGMERLMDMINTPKNNTKLYCHLTEKTKVVLNARNEFNFTSDFVKGLKWANQLRADFVFFEKDGKIIKKDLKTGKQNEL